MLWEEHFFLCMVTFCCHRTEVQPLEERVTGNRAAAWAVFSKRNWKLLDRLGQGMRSAAPHPKSGSCYIHAEATDPLHPWFPCHTVSPGPACANWALPLIQAVPAWGAWPLQKWPPHSQSLAAAPQAQPPAAPVLTVLRLLPEGSAMLPSCVGRTLLCASVLSDHIFFSL